VISSHPADYESANAAQNAQPWLYSGSDHYYFVSPLGPTGLGTILIYRSGDNTDVVFHQVVR
jgi:hypothetical protein